MYEEYGVNKDHRSKCLQCDVPTPRYVLRKLQLSLEINYMYIFTVMISMKYHLLMKKMSRLFLPVCKRLDLPAQPPISVTFLKRVSVIENPTGRTIDYRPSDESASNANVVSISSRSSAAQLGKIRSLFAYRGINFTIIEIFECENHYCDGIVCVTDCTNTSKVLLPLADVSRPLVIAIENFPQLYILNL